MLLLALLVMLVPGQGQGAETCLLQRPRGPGATPVGRQHDRHSLPAQAPPRPSPPPPADKKYGWGSQDWGAATWRKVHVVGRLVQLGFNVVLSDLDVAWLRDPHQYFVHRWNQ
jgi:hypothetical protein